MARYTTSVLTAAICVSAGLISFQSIAQNLRPPPPGAAEATVTVNDQGRPGLPKQGGAVSLPWEKELRKFYERQDGIFRAPKVGLPRVGGKDPLAVLGLKRHTPDDLLPKGPASQEVPVFAPHVSGLDSNGDGGVTRNEYFGGKLRYGRLSPQGQFRQRRHRERLTRQFQKADANNDGRVTARELAITGQTRF